LQHLPPLALKKIGRQYNQVKQSPNRKTKNQMLVSSKCGVVVVRWHGKAAEHSRLPWLFCSTFFVKKKSGN